ncbi:cytochrome c biogenesis protein ResB [Spirochaeta cellobiosiphila]|uniref:cytochrome c biogenesis protein ResB n=1 Tax=Spirochaeta cellobiosiphila TaxID=504483 RepID=UPI0004160FC7|nr:cytochrome c biogenesis protein ResB [Spirochaeta cellobiosiphila]
MIKFKKVFYFIFTLRFGLSLLGVLILIMIPAGFLSQGHAPSYYINQYGFVVGRLITVLQYNLFFSSPLFITVVLLFGLNLAGCTLVRLSKSIKSKRKDFGPDIIHIGILLVIVGGVTSAMTAERLQFYLKPGQALQIGSNLVIGITDFEFQKDEKGYPKQWISTGIMTDREGHKISDFMTSVNNPYRYHGITIYQYSYNKDQDGQYHTGLLVVRDTGKNIIFPAFIIIIIGIFTSYYKRIRNVSKSP